MIVQVDTHKFAPVRVQDKNNDWYLVRGKCKRCGKCGCQTCDHFTHEAVDGKEVGKCMRQFEKPFMCVLFPYDPHTPLPEGCGFTMEKE